MIPRLVAGGWGAAVLLVASARRPLPHRVRSLAAADGPVRSTPLGALELLGAFLLRAAGRVTRREPADPDGRLARRVGCAFVAGAFGLASIRVMAVPLAALAWVVVARGERRAERRRLDELERDLPEVVDLLSLAVGAGLNISLAVAAVARRGAGPLSLELARVTDESARGRRLADALEDLPARAGEAVRPLVAALVSGERYGSPLGESLERLAHETRAHQRRRCETAARRVPVTLLFPLVTCILPAFGLLTVAPLIAGSLAGLRL